MKTNRSKRKQAEGIRPGFWFLGGLLLLGGITGAVLHFGKKKKKAASTDPQADFPETPKPKANPGTSRRDSFPLKKGSQGPRVAKVQQVLIQRYGKQILPRFGADGKWGGETEKALSSQGWPTRISESQYRSFFGFLSGLPALRAKLHSLRPTEIFKGDLAIGIPGGLFLGEEIHTEGGYSFFKNGKGETFGVAIQDVAFR